MLTDPLTLPRLAPPEPKTQTCPAPAPPLLAVDARQLAQMLAISLRHLRRLQSSGGLPTPIRLGGSRRWVLDGPRGIRAWLAAGAPNRELFEKRNEPAT